MHSACAMNAQMYTRFLCSELQTVPADNSRTLVNNGVEQTMPNNPSNPNRGSNMGSPNQNTPRQQGQGKQQDKSNVGSQQQTKDRGMSGSGRDDSGQH